ncbi:MAG: hypothetical protein IH625_09995 [Rhodobacteraceae bacterium]|nr:hypothetical protein [Paracoccaceae bacterium]
MPTINVSDFALNYLKHHAEPLVDTTVSVLDRILSEHESLKASKQSATTLEMRFGGKELPSVKFTTILSAKVAGKPASQRYWNNILEDMIAACVARGAEPSDVQSLLQANVMQGNHAENGYRYVPTAGFSFQGLEANRICRNLAALAERYQVPLDIELRWQDDDKAAFPNQTARIILP